MTLPCDELVRTELRVIIDRERAAAVAVRRYRERLLFLHIKDVQSPAPDGGRQIGKMLQDMDRQLVIEARTRAMRKVAW